MTMQHVVVSYTETLVNLGVTAISNGIDEKGYPMAILMLSPIARTYEILDELSSYFSYDDQYEDKGEDIGRFLVVLGLEYKNE